ncbi:hypothetical protein K402DRAFT_406794 [Aulographum hederae CBS 113979]|uniref:AD domain-containing protein n=1 Tax=Aulographum hederae CBS 113979 TaxID=1176131 RepID=A0A6G1GRJ1_9PEZI|nr:hypothetical protein K402DRAFT_406794 [Aulographum hederae CBS 113979]
MADNSAKRQSLAGRVATPKIGGQPINDDSLLSLAIGAQSVNPLRTCVYTSLAALLPVATNSVLVKHPRRSIANTRLLNSIKISTIVLNQTLEGAVYIADPVTHLLVIDTASTTRNPTSNPANHMGDYHIIPVSNIKSMELIALPKDTDLKVDGTSGFETASPNIAKIDLDALRAREEAAIRKMKEKDATKGKGVTKEGQEIFDALHRLLPCRWHESQIIVNNNVIISAPYGLDNCKAAADGQKTLPMVHKTLQGHYSKKKNGATTGTSTPVPQAPQASSPNPATVNRPPVATPIPPRKGG